MKNIEIMTCNSVYKNGERVDYYHEIHKINYLQNTQHLIATIESIIKNNLLFGCDNTVLEEICISCADQKVTDEINEHYKGKCGRVKLNAGFILIKWKR